MFILGSRFQRIRHVEAAAAGVPIGNPFPHNVIPTSLLSPQALALLKLLEPDTKGVTLGSGVGDVNGLDKNFNEPGTGLFNSNMWTERVDYTINEKMHAFERFSRFWDTLSGTVMFGAAGGPGFGINNYGGNSNGANDSLASGMDIAISPKLLTDFRLGYYRYNVIDTKHDQGTEFATHAWHSGHQHRRQHHLRLAWVQHHQFAWRRRRHQR